MNVTHNLCRKKVIRIALSLNIKQNKTMRDTGELETYIFFRGDNWYPVFLKDDVEAVYHARENAGTTRVEDLEGRLIWEKTE